MAKHRIGSVGTGLCLVAAVLAACGSTKTGAPSASSTTTTTAAPSTKAGDAALAAEELLPASAFPAGWKGQGAASKNSGASFFGGSSSADVNQIVSCLGMSSAHVDANPVEDAGQEYDDPNSDLTVTDTVDVFPSTIDAVTDVEAGANPKTPTCLVQLEGPQITKALPQGSTAGQLSAEDASLPSDGSHHAALLIHFPFTYQGVSATLYLEFVVVQKDRSESNLAFDDADSPPPASVVNALALAAANRLRSS